MTARGKNWEAILDAWHHQYRRDKRALILRGHPPVKMLSKNVNGKFRACFAGTGPPDYVGVASGRMVCFDAKDSRAARFPFSSLKDHQARDLSATDDHGGLAFIALRLRGAPSVVLWSELRADWWAWRRKESRVASCLGGIPMQSDGWISCLPI